MSHSKQFGVGQTPALALEAWNGNAYRGRPLKSELFFSGSEFSRRSLFRHPARLRLSPIRALVSMPGRICPRTPPSFPASRKSARPPRRNCHFHTRNRRSRTPGYHSRLPRPSPPARPNSANTSSAASSATTKSANPATSCRRPTRRETANLSTLNRQ